MTASSVQSFPHKNKYCDHPLLENEMTVSEDKERMARRPEQTYLIAALTADDQKNSRVKQLYVNLKLATTTVIMRCYISWHRTFSRHNIKESSCAHDL